MTAETFNREIERWIADVRAEAERLHGDGVPSEHCLSNAINIANAKAMKRATDRQRFSGVQAGTIG